MNYTSRQISKQDGRIPNSVETLPLIIESKDKSSVDQLSDHIESNAAQLKNLLNIHGAILFRNFYIKNVKHFERIALSFCPKLSSEHLLDDGIRQWATQHVYYASMPNKKQSFAPLGFHNEDVFLKIYPKYIFFSCIKPPRIGGETPLVDCRVIYSKLGKELLSYFSRNNSLDCPLILPYHTLAHNCKTKDKTQIEKILFDFGAYQVTWECEHVIARFRLPVIINNVDSNQYCWFNRVKTANIRSLVVDILLSCMHCRSYGMKFGSTCYVLYDLIKYLVFNFNLVNFKKKMITLDNGENIPFSYLAKIAYCYWHNSIILKWQPGDIMIVNNELMAHGRMPYIGKREILSCISYE